MWHPYTIPPPPFRPIQPTFWSLAKSQCLCSAKKSRLRHFQIHQNIFFKEQTYIIIKDLTTNGSVGLEKKSLKNILLKNLSQTVLLLFVIVFPLQSKHLAFRSLVLRFLWSISNFACSLLWVRLWVIYLFEHQFDKIWVKFCNFYWVFYVCDFQVFCEDHYFNIASNCLFFFDLIISFVYMIVELQGIGCKIQSCLNLWRNFMFKSICNGFVFFPFENKINFIYF